MTPAATTDIAALSGVKASTAERIFKDVGGEGIAVLCKATGLKRQFLRGLWKSLRRSDEDADFVRVSEVYETIAVAKAQTVLRYWNWSLVSAFGDADDDGAAGFSRDLQHMDAATALTAFGR